VIKTINFTSRQIEIIIKYLKLASGQQVSNSTPTLTTELKDIVDLLSK